MENCNLKDLPVKEIAPGYSARHVHSDNMTMQYCHIKEGAPMPEHAHPHEQITTLVTGRFEMIVDGEKMLLEEGAVLVIPSNVKHSGMPLTDCYIIDAFYPSREEFRG